MSLVSYDALNEVFRDFYNLTGFKIVLFDSNRVVKASYPPHMCRFCEEVRRYPELAEKCFECDRLGFEEVDRTGKPYIYKCHMSATEAISPIFAGEERVGYLMFGQIAEGDRSGISQRAEEESLKTRIRIGADMIDEMRAVSREYIESAVNMMSMCASYLYTSRIITTDPNVLAYRISGYIDENIKTCSLESICKRFYISRSRLYSICIEFFGMGVSELIRCRKIKLSEKYLVETDLSIDEIAENVGIKNANYLIRIFKSTHGITPHKYRIKYAKCK